MTVHKYDGQSICNVIYQYIAHTTSQTAKKWRVNITLGTAVISPVWFQCSTILFMCNHCNHEGVFFILMLKLSEIDR